MRLSQYAKHMNITYKTASRWYRAGLLDAYQLPTRTIIVREPLAQQPVTKIALYARVSSADQKDDLTRFDFEYIRKLLEIQQRPIEVVFETDTNDE